MRLLSYLQRALGTERQRRNSAVITRLDFESLESRYLLTAGVGSFERTNPTTDVTAIADAKANDKYSGQYESVEPILAHVIAMATSSEYYYTYGPAHAEAEMGALALDQGSAGVNGPLVSAGGATAVQVSDEGLALTPVTYSYDDSGANPYYTYHAPIGFTGDLDFHGHLLVNAQVFETVIGYVLYNTDYVNLSEIYVGGRSNDVFVGHNSSNTNPNDDWYVQWTDYENHPDAPVQDDLIPQGVFLHISFTIPIEDLDAVNFTSYELARADAESNGGSADLTHTAASYAWGYVTPADEDVTAGDFNYDGLVDAEDYKIFAAGSPQADVSGPTTGVPDGVVDAHDFDIWAANQTGVIVVSNANDELDTNYSAGDLSLREALTLAAESYHPGTDTIVFDPSVTNITLAYRSVPGGRPDSFSASNVDILGPGADKLTISGGGLNTVFNAFDS